MELYELPRGSEIITSLPLKHNPYRRYTLFSLEIPNLLAGDIVSLQCQYEATNPYTYNVMLAQTMMVHRAETIVSNLGVFPEGEYVAPCFPAGDNVSRNRHHVLRNLAGAFKAGENGTHWVSLVVYAASSAASSGHALVVHKNYGGLSAVVHRSRVTEVISTQSGTFNGEFHKDGTISGIYEVDKDGV